MTIPVELSASQFVWSGSLVWVSTGLVAVDPSHIALYDGAAATPLLAGYAYEARHEPGRSVSVRLWPWNMPPGPRTIRAVRRTPAVQQTTFEDLRPFDGETIEKLHDQCAMRDAELRRDADAAFGRLDAAEPALADLDARAVRVMAGETAVTLPPVGERGGRFAAYDAAGWPVATDAPLMAIPIAGDPVDLSSRVALRAASPPAAATYLRLAGYNAGGDGLAHMMQRRLAASNATDMAADGSFWGPVGDMLTLDHFGGGYGSATADTRALMAMIAEQKVALLGPRAYRIDRDAAAYAATLAGAVYLRGLHRTASRIEWVGATTPSSLLRGAAASVNTWIVENLTIDAKRESVGDNTSYFAALDFQGAARSRLILRDVDFLSGRIMDARVVGPSAAGERIDADVTGCRFFDGMVGSATRSAIALQVQGNVDFDVTGNRFELAALPSAYGRGGCVVQLGDGMPATAYASGAMARNRFRYMGRGDADTLGCCDVYSGGKEVLIVDNIAVESRGRVWSIKGDQRSMTIAHNVARHVYGPLSNTTAIALFQDLFDAEADYAARIVGNIVDGCDGRGIFVDGEGLSGGRFSNVDIAGNDIRDCAGEAIYGRYVADTLRVRGNRAVNCLNGFAGPATAKSIVVEANEFASLDHVINLTADLTGSDVVVEGNRLVGPGGASSRAVALAACRSYRVERNHIESVGIGVVTGGSTQPSLIDGNHFGTGVVSTWSKGGTDAAVWWGGGNSGVDLPYALRNLTIAAGAVTAYAPWHYLTGEGGVVDDLTTVTLPLNRQTVLRPASNTVDITVKDSATLDLPADVLLNNTRDTLTVANYGGVVMGIAFSSNSDV